MNFVLVPLIFTIMAQSICAESLVFPPYFHSYGIRKATQQHLIMFGGPFNSFVNPQGIATTKMISRDEPANEKDDDEVVVYGVNSGRHMLIYNTSMYALALYGSRGSGKDNFLFPRGIAADPEGRVYVADAGNNRIVQLFNPQKNVRWVRSFGAVIAGTDPLRAPDQIGLDRSGNVYVTDKGNRRIVVFDSSGTFKTIIKPSVHKTTAAFIDGPTTLAIADGWDKWSFFGNERVVFCADQNGHRLWKLSLTGEVLKTITLSEPNQAAYAAVDYYHNLYITDSLNHRILKYDHNLEILDTIGSFGNDKNQFVAPRGIGIWKRYGQTFVAEREGAQYYWHGTRAIGPVTMQRDKGAFILALTTSDYSFASLFSTKGRDTTYFLNKQFIPAGRTMVPIVKSARTDSMSGKKIQLKLEPTYSSYTYNAWFYPVLKGANQ